MNTRNDSERTYAVATVEFTEWLRIHTRKRRYDVSGNFTITDVWGFGGGQHPLPDGRDFCKI